MSQTLSFTAQDLINDVEKTLDSFQFSLKKVNTGRVIYLGDGVAKVAGLKKVAYNEVVEFESGAKGVAMNLEDDHVGIVMLSGFSTVQE